jgi:hypothetical protein
MGSTNRKAQLFVDKCPADPIGHKIPEKCKRDFSSRNCPSMLQPLDLEIIHFLKIKYRRTMAQKATAATERKAELKLNALQAMHMIVSLWNAVSQMTIASCFRKASLNNNNDDEITEIGIDTDEDEVREEWEKVTPNEDTGFSDFVGYDNGVSTTSAMSTDEL